jgi:hypothetical protein
MSLKTWCLLVCLATSCTLGAQGYTYGVKAGLTFTQLKGPLEKAGDGTAVESMKNNTGFHVGAIFGYAFNEHFGAQAELMYAQKGGRYSLNATDSYLHFQLPDFGTVDATGAKKTVNSITLNYLEVPLLLYYKPTKFIKVGAGAHIGLLLAANGNGEVVFNGIKNTQGNDLILRLSYAYGKDKLHGYNGALDNPIVFGNEPLNAPSEVGAYFFEDSDEGNFFKPIDVGLDADLTFFLSRGISLGLRMGYGLNDVTNNAYDRSQLVRSVLRADKDTNLSYQVSFSFNFSN